MKKFSARGVSSDDHIASRTTQGRQSKTRFLVRELGGETWPDFARIVEKHNGVWGGCWCTAFHLKRSEEKEWAGKHRELKEKLVRANRSHAALVYDGYDVVEWYMLGPHCVFTGRVRGYGDLFRA